MTKIKICGIQTAEAALTAAESGADLIGFVFVPGRRRRLEPDQAREILSAVRRGSGNVPKAVGLFADQPLEEVNRIAGTLGLDMAQICGQESLEYCAKVDVPVIKVLHVKGGGEEEVASLGERMAALERQGHWITLDRYVKGLQGGSGRTFDWEIARRLSQKGFRFLLAGGLTPENVAQAVRTVKPWGVDVSSGVETDGVKDPQKIRAFIHQVKTASNEAHTVKVDIGKERS